MEYEYHLLLRLGMSLMILRMNNLSTCSNVLKVWYCWKKKMFMDSKTIRKTKEQEEDLRGMQSY
jgi:uncharacterized membrane protein